MVLYGMHLFQVNWFHCTAYEFSYISKEDANTATANHATSGTGWCPGTQRTKTSNWSWLTIELSHAEKFHWTAGPEKITFPHLKCQWTNGSTTQAIVMWVRKLLHEFPLWLYESGGGHGNVPHHHPEGWLNFNLIYVDKKVHGGPWTWPWPQWGTRRRL